MKIASDELEEYIRATLASIKKGVHADKESRIQGLIEFDLAVTNVKEGKSGLKIYVVAAGGKLRSEQVSRIRFRVRPYGAQVPEK